MLRDEAIDMMKVLMAYRRDSSDVYVSALKLAQSQLEIGPTKPWFLLSEDANIRLTIGEQRIRLPSDFLSEYDEAGLRHIPDIASASPVDLRKEQLDQLQKDYLFEGSGAPEAYALKGEYFVIFPVPDDTYYIEMPYYKRDEALTSNVENNWLKWVPYLLIGEAGLFMATGARDMEAKKEFQRLKNEGLIMLNTQNEARAHENMVYQVGGPH